VYKVFFSTGKVKGGLFSSTTSNEKILSLMCARIEEFFSKKEPNLTPKKDLTFRISSPGPLWIRGSWDSWSRSYEMAPSENEIWYITLLLPPGTYQFKFHDKNNNYFSSPSYDQTNDDYHNNIITVSK